MERIPVCCGKREFFLLFVVWLRGGVGLRCVFKAARSVPTFLAVFTIRAVIAALCSQDSSLHFVPL